MSIKVNDLFSELALDFGVRESSERFRSKFLYKLNSVLSDITADAFYETTPATNIQDVLDLPEHMYDILRTGLSWKMQESGEYGREPDTRVMNKYQVLLGRLQSQYYDDNGVNTLSGSSS